jgi:hypothetical protein
LAPIPGWSELLNFFNQFAIPVLIGLIILILVIMIAIQAIFLKIALGFADATNTGFGAVFVTALINTLLLLIPCIGCILNWVVINARHDTGFAAAIGVWILAFIIQILVIVAIFFVLGFSIPFIPSP